MFYSLGSSTRRDSGNVNCNLRRLCTADRFWSRLEQKRRCDGGKPSTFAAKCLFGCVVASVVFGNSGRAATTSAASTTPASIQSDGGVVKSGDVIIWQVNKSVTLEPGNTPTTACFPVRSRFNVTNVVAATKPAGAATTAAAPATATSTAAPSTPPATTANTQIVSGHFSSSKAYSLLHPFHFDALPKTDGSTPPCGVDTPNAVLDTSYDFTADQLSKQDFFRQGFTWGGLVIPYKFYFKDKSIKSNSSIVGFAGYEGWFPGVSLSAVLAAGAGTAPSNSTSTNSTGSTTSTTTNSSTETLVTYTVATGLIMAFGDSKTVKAGLMFGRDYQGNASAFAYENKWWMALSIGAGF